MTLPTYFISHGGGPWPYMKDELGGAYDILEASLKGMPEQLGSPMRPKAILMISGHWEEQDFTVMTHATPPMIYDYSGFPEHTYHIHYKAPGSPELAARVQELLTTAGIASRADAKRGFDHGAYAPLAVMYPHADIPVVQLSIRSDYDPEAHLQLGRALAPLREEGILIIGSGLSYHNLRRFGAAAAAPSKEFDVWLGQTLTASNPNQRTERLLAWAKAPSARLAHPQEDHLIPLMVAVGAAEQEKGEMIYHEEKFMGGVTVSSFRFTSIAP